MRASLADAMAMNADSLQAMLPPKGMASVVLDGYFMKENADDVFEKNEQAQVPLLAGWNSLEGHPAQALAGQAPTLQNYKNAMKATFGDMTDEIFKAYGIETDEDVLSQKGLDLASDLFTGFPTWKVCDYHAKSGLPVYRYHYMHPRPQVSAKMGDKVGALAGGVREKTAEEKKAEAQQPAIAPGAVHSADIEYAMGTLDTNEYYDWQKEDYAISKLFLTYYANFCKTGNPNGEGLPQWTAITKENLDAAPVMKIDVESAEVASPEKENAYRTLEKFYNVAGMKMMQLSDEILREHYAHLVDKPFFPSLAASMQASPVVALALEGVDAVQVVRTMTGSTNGREAAPGTIRGDYSMSNQQNIVHASDSTSNAEIELKRFFKDEEIFDYTSGAFGFIYGSGEAK